MKQLDLIPKDKLHPFDSKWTPPSSFPDLSSANTIAVDLETCDPDLIEKGPGTRRGAFIAGIAIGTDDGFRGYYPIGHKFGGNMDRDMVLAWVKDELSRPNQPKVGANLIYDLEHLHFAGVPVAGKLYDVQYAEPLLDEHMLSYSLGNIAKERIGEQKVTNELYDWIQAAYGVRSNHGNHIWESPVGLVGPYAEGDVDLPLKIFQNQKEDLINEDLWDLFEMECSLIPMLLQMRINGVRVDVGRAERIGASLQREINRWQKELNALMGTFINVDSAGDVAKIFDKYNLYYPKTPTGKPSFRKDWLENLNLPHPEIQLILGIRKYSKLLGTFIQGYILNSHVNGRVYGSFHPLRGEDGGTIVGRFSSSCPNLQNIPMRDKTMIVVDGVQMPLGKAIRSCFIPEDDCDWLKMDYSQIQFRLITHYGTGEKAEEAREQYRNDPKTDFHDLVAKMCNIERDAAKTINFGLAFVMGAEKLATSLGIDVGEASKLFEKYHARVPFVKLLQSDAARVAANRGYIRSILKRRSRFPFWESTDWDTAHDPRNKPVRDSGIAMKLWGSVRRAHTWIAMNRLMQMSEGDIVKKSMSEIFKAGICDVLKIHLTVHDELDWSKPRTKEADEAHAEAGHIMETCVKLSLPVNCESEIGPTWGEVKKI